MGHLCRPALYATPVSTNTNNKAGSPGCTVWPNHFKEMWDTAHINKQATRDTGTTKRTISLTRKPKNNTALTSGNTALQEY
jgi:hypothetical protein